MSISLDKLLKGAGSSAQQLFVWQVLGQLVAVMLAPAFSEIQRAVNEASQTTPLTPAELAAMVVRHIVPEGDAEAYAKQSGIAPSDFARMVQNYGSGPAPDALAEALRRQLIPEHGTGPQSVSFEQGIAESDLRDKWTNVVKQLAVQFPSPTDALDALLEGQVDEQTARSLYSRFGGADEFFTLLFNTRGSAPTPLEAADMANRGIIPWEGSGPGVVSFQQAFLEGPWRDKWMDPYKQLAVYKPPARTITAMVRSGALTDAQALVLYGDLGMSADQAAAQLADAHHTKTQAERDLTVSQVKALFQDGLITGDEARQMLALLRYNAEDQAFLLDVWEFQTEQAKVRSAVSKVHNLYVAHKIDATEALNTLNALGVPADGVQQNLTIWKLERDANVAILTAAEVADAVFYQVIPLDEGIARLVNLGWSEDDARIRIMIRLHGKLPQPPAA